MSEEEEVKGEDEMIDLGDEVDFDGDLDFGDEDDLLVGGEIDDLEMSTHEIE